MVAEFLTPLRTEKIGERSLLLTDDLIFRSAKYAGVFIAPRGFQTDLASIPRIAWVLFPKVGDQDRGSVIHDGGYAGALVTEHGDRIHTVKFVADNLFLEGMIADDVGAVAREWMYRAVVLFGNPNTHPLVRNAQTVDALARTGQAVRIVA